MNNFFDHVLNHRTIRQFKGEVPKDKLDLIFDGIIRTPTSMGQQMASVIHVTDQAKKDAIAEVCNQPYVADAPVLLIYLADYYRNYRIMEDTDQLVELDSHVDIFFQGVTDAILMAMNTNSMVESLDMGAVFLGSILNNSEKMIEILELPELTFPILGLGFGPINEDPQLKPRMPKENRIFENSYKSYEDYGEELKAYDQELTKYYDLRDKGARSDSFFKQIVKGAENQNPIRLKILEIARNNGWKI